ncbi:MAG: threonine synthase [Bacteroidota bacterium]
MNSPISYFSTNQTGSPVSNQSCDFREALFRGLAPDDGLYIFDQIPHISPSQLSDLRQVPYADLAYYILNLFLETELDSATLKKLCQEAYGASEKWPSGVSIPIKELDKYTYLASLDRGPTASFKDFAAQLMARLFSHYLSDTSDTLRILVATSGDTGSAIGEAFRGIKGTEVYILYPRLEVSPVQKQQLEGIGENVFTLCIDGKFDDCQSIVKEAFLDPALDTFNLTSANSINIGRLLPQVVYYFYIYLQLSQENEPLVVSVPSGNLGNSLAGEIARRMGLPLEKILIATNQNKAFPKFLNEGDYQPIRPSLKCVSNAMNVGNPSNLARFFHLYQGQVDRMGNIRQEPDLEEMRQNLVGYSFTDEETRRGIKDLYHNFQLISEPHTSIAFLALRQFQESFGSHPPKGVCLGTAHPAKFPEVVLETLGLAPESSPSLSRLHRRDLPVQSLPASYASFRDYLKEKVNSSN